MPDSLPTPAKLFISYRRAHSAAINQLCTLLERHGVSVWLDSNDVNELDEFPARTLAGLAGSHAVLVWWSLDYAESRFCLEEFRLAWTMARAHPASEGQRIWIVNPEDPLRPAQHIRAGDLDAYSYLLPPAPDKSAAWAQTRRTDLQALARHGPLCERPVRATSPARYGVPTSRPMVGRGNELWQVHSALFPQQIGGAVAPPLVQLHGMPGVGKSALAAHYADTFAAAYPGGVWWFRLGPGCEMVSVQDAGLAWLSALEHSLGTLHPGLLATLSRDSQGQALPPPLVRERLARHLAAGGSPGPYLWVLEKLPLIEDEDLRQDCLAFLRAPTADGRTLVTSPDSAPFADATSLALNPLAPADGEALLGRYLAPAQRKLERQTIADLAAEVNGHPLALVLIGQRVSASSSGLGPVLQEVRRISALDSLERTWPFVRKQLGRQAPSVVAAIQASLEKPLDDEARHLLALASVCAAHAPVPMPLLKRAFRASDAANDPADDEVLTLRFDAAVGALVRNSLMSLDATDRQHASVHALVSAVMIKLLGRQPQRERRAIADALLARLAPLGLDGRAFMAVRTDAPHAMAILSSRQAAAEAEEKAAEGAAEGAAEKAAVLGRDTVTLALGLYRLQDALGLPSHALAAARQADAWATRELGPTDPDRLRAQTALSSAMASAGLLEQAAALQEALWPLAVQVFGEHHEDALEIRSLLATTRHHQDRLQEAEQLRSALVQTLRRLPELQGKVLPPTLLSLSATLHNLGRLSEAHACAEEAHQRILADEAVNGFHPDGVIAQHNIAAIRLAMGDVAKALELERQVLHKAEQVFGVDHAHTRLARLTVADIQVARGEHDEAIGLYQQVLQQATAALGDEHPECLVAMSRLIAAHSARAHDQDTCYQDSRDNDSRDKASHHNDSHHEAARKLWPRFLAAALPVLPAGHADAVAAVKGLASQLRDLGLPIGPLAPLLEQVVKTRLRERGISHVDTGLALDDWLFARSEIAAAGPTLALRIAALDAARALQCGPVDRLAALLVAHHELITLLRTSGHFEAAAQAEIDAMADLKAARRSVAPK